MYIDMKKLNIRSRIINFITAVIIIAVIFLFLNGCRSSAGGDFTLEDIEGNSWTLSELRGKIVVLNFWATWCPPCREEIPDFIKVYEEYKDRGVQFLGISSEDISTLGDFNEYYGINYPILIDDGGVMRKWSVQAIPTTFVLDGEGNIVFKNVGIMTAEQLKNTIEDIL